MHRRHLPRRAAQRPDVQDLLVALGLAIALEGLLYAAFPGPMKRMLVAMLGTEETVLRMAGLAAAASGLVLIWMVRS